MRHFFAVWDTVEQMHPWGIERMQPLLADFGVSAALCEEIDSRLYVDLMIARQPDVQRIRVEGRRTGVVFWVQVEGVGESGALRVSFQRSPARAFDCIASVAARPAALMACLAAHHRVVLVAMGRFQCKLKLSARIGSNGVRMG
jgi:hypothetical protein